MRPAASAGSRECTRALSSSTSSEVMAAISSTGNRTTELRLLTILHAHGITGWRRHQPLPGKPDFVFRREHLAVFVDGCFWHGCPWHCRMPKSRHSYWEPKVRRNKARDKAIRRVLQQAGWKVHRIWEHSLNNPSVVITRLNEALQNAVKRDSEVP